LENTGLKASLHYEKFLRFFPQHLLKCAKHEMGISKSKNTFVTLADSKSAIEKAVPYL
jgi:hypothetical protein